MGNFEIKFSTTFLKNYESLVRRNKLLQKRIDLTLEKLSEDPFQNGLRTHKAGTRNYGKRYSSWVTGDLRLIWDLEEYRLVIIVITIEGHEVYR